MNFTESLKKNEDFKKVYNRRNSKADSNFIVYKCENGLPVNRIGVSVSKKVGNSVVRHRIKRLVKESYRTIEDKLCIGQDLVVVARQGSKEADFYSVKNSLLRLFTYHRLIKP